MELHNYFMYICNVKQKYNTNITKNLTLRYEDFNKQQRMFDL